MTMENLGNSNNGGDMGLGGETEERGWRLTGTAAPATGSIFVETGRGNAVEVPVGSPFVETLNRLSEEARYGGFFRIFLNGLEVINPTDAPAAIEAGMRISITAYDKVG